MANYPTIVNELQQLRAYKTKQAYSNAQVATALTAFGWAWSETHVAKLLAGKAKLSANDVIFLRRFLLNAFYTYNCS